MLPFRLLILSIALHFLVLFFLSQIPTWTPLSQFEKTEIEIVTVEKPKKRAEKVFIPHTEVSEKQLEESDKEAKYWSKTRQRVKKQTKAREIGKTRNRTPRKKAKSAKNKKSRQTYDFGTEPINKVTRNTLLDATPSTIGQEIPDDIPHGSVTSLNTDHFTYYSFYSRVADLFRFRWDSNLRRAVSYLNRRAFRGRYRDKWVTQLRVFLDAKGRYKRSVVIRSSGLKEIDNAAIYAFQDAEFFPNPPRDLVVDGQIELNYRLTYYWKPSLWTQR